MTKYCYEYPRPALTVDIVLFCYKEDKLHTLLIHRKNNPFAGMWAFPGGFVDSDEVAEQAAHRELGEETGVHGVQLKQLYTETALNRDPRGWIVSTVFIGLVPSNIEITAGDDASNAEWFPVLTIPDLVFGHEVYLKKGLKIYREELLFNVFGKELLPDEFALKTLYKLYLQLIDIPEQIEKVVKRLINYGALIQIGEKWHFEKGRYEAIKIHGYLK